jgi:UTP--glucose-1-phosphate uridylyltransferase
VFQPRIFDYLERTAAGKGNEIQLTDAIGSLIADGGRVLGVTLSAAERRFDIGNFPSYFQAFFEFAMEDPQYGEELRGFAKKILERGR